MWKTTTFFKASMGHDYSQEPRFNPQKSMGRSRPFREFTWYDKRCSQQSKKTPRSHNQANGIEMLQAYKKSTFLKYRLLENRLDSLSKNTSQNGHLE